MPIKWKNKNIVKIIHGGTRPLTEFDVLELKLTINFRPYVDNGDGTYNLSPIEFNLAQDLGMPIVKTTYAVDWGDGTIGYNILLSENLCQYEYASKTNASSFSEVITIKLYGKNYEPFTTFTKTVGVQPTGYDIIVEEV